MAQRRRIYNLIKERNPSDDLTPELQRLLKDSYVDLENVVQDGNSILKIVIDKCDTQCLQFLLKSSTKKERSFFETAEELIGDHKNKFKEIENLVKKKKSETEFIQDKYIYKLKYADLNSENIKKFKNVRILKLRNCPSITSALRVVRDNQLRLELFSEKSFLFVLVFSGDFKLISLTSQDNLILKNFPKDRSLIVQIVPTEANNKTFIIDGKSRIVSEILMKTRGRTERALAVATTIKYKDNVVQAMIGNLTNKEDHASKFFLKNVDGEEQNPKLVSLSSSLCARFLMLFKESSSVHDEAMVQALNEEKVATVFALLDLPFIQKDEELMLNDYQRKLLNLKDKKGSNLLELLIRLNDIENVKVFSKLIPFISIEASNLCWELGRYECLYELLVEEYCFPSEFALEELVGKVDLQVWENFKEIVDRNKEFHRYVSSGDLDKLKEIVLNNTYLKTDLKYVYDVHNQSALTTALKSSQPDIFSFLQSEGFDKGEDKSYQNIRDKLTESEKAEIGDTNLSYFQSSDTNNIDLLLTLTSKSKLSVKTKRRAEYFERIRKMYEDLSKLPTVFPLMKAIANSEQLLIVFDFNKDSVEDMDPLSNKNTNGLSMYLKGYILIAAGKCETDPDEVLGVLAHEIAHYAMYLTYENECLPYHKEDKKNKSRFGEIVTELEQLCNKREVVVDFIINVVFTSYFKCDWHKEMIVRVPHLHAKYKAEELKSKENSFKNLFDFYKEIVLPYVETNHMKIKTKYEIKELNERIGEISSIDNRNLEFNEKTLKECGEYLSSSENGLTVFVTKTPTMQKDLIYQWLKTSHADFAIQKCIFSQIRSFDKPSLVAEIEASFNSSLQPKLIISHTLECSLEKCFPKMLLFLKTAENSYQRIILVITSNKMCQSELETIPKSLREENLRFEQLSVKTQKQFINKDLSFQGGQTTFNKMQVEESLTLKAFEDELEEFVTSEVFEFNTASSPVPPSNNFSIRRNFKMRKTINRKDTFLEKRHLRKGSVDPKTSSFRELDFNQKSTKFETMNDDEDKYEFIEKTFEKILVDAREKKITIISDIAGTGKTEVLNSIAKELKIRHPSRWVCVIDLKKYVDSFKSSPTDLNKFSQCFASTFIKDSIFEQEVFKEMFINRNTVVLFDGFDEISPDYKSFVLSMLKLFKTGSGNQLWVTTRSNLCGELEESLGVTSYSLVPLNLEEQKNLFVTFSKIKNPDAKTLDLEKNAENIFKKLPLISTIGAPQLVKILSAIDDIEFSNLYSIYNKIVVRKIKIMQSKGKLAQEELQKVHSLSEPTNTLRVHEKIALRSLRSDFRVGIDVEYNKMEWGDETISRVGLVMINSGGDKFQHETYKEYFFAQYIINKLKIRENIKIKPQIKRVLELMANFMLEKRFEVTRNFLNDVLESKLGSNPEEVYRTFGEILDEHRDAYKDILLQILLESRMTLINFTLNSLKFSQEPTRKLVLRAKYREENQETSDKTLHLAVRVHSKDIIEKFCGLFRETFDGHEHELKEELKRCGRNKRNLFHCCLMNTETQALSIIMNIFSRALTDEVEELLKGKDVHGDNVFHFLFLRNNELAWNDLVGLLENPDFLSSNQLDNILKEPNLYGSKPIHLAILFQKGEIVRSLLKVLKRRLEDHVRKEIFLSVGYENKNIFLCSALNKEDDEMIEVLIEESVDVLDRLEVKQLLQRKDSRKNNILHLIRLPGALKNLFSKLEDFSYDEKKAMFLETNYEGQNVLQSASEFQDESFVEALCTLTKEKLEESDQRAVFTAVATAEGRNAGKNVFHFAALNNKNDGIFSVLRKYANENDIGTLLKQKDEENNSVLHCFHSDENDSSLQEMLTLSLDFLDVQERKNLYLSKNNDQTNFFHLLINNNDKSLVEYFIAHREILLGDDEGLWKKLLLSWGPNNKSIFQSATENKKHEGILKVLWKSSSILSDTERISMLKNKTKNSFNVLHCLRLHRSENTLKDLFEILKESKMDEASLKSLLTEKNNEGNCCSHQVVSTSKKGLVSSLMGFTKDILEKDDQIILFSELGKDEKNIFQSAALNYENDGIFLTLWGCIKDLFDDNAMKALLTHKDIRGCTVIHSSLKHNNGKAFSELLSIYRKYYCTSTSSEYISDESIFDHLLTKNTEGNNCLHLLLHHNSPNVLTTFMKRLSLDKSFMYELFTSIGEKEKNIFHFAASNQNLEPKSKKPDTMLTALLSEINKCEVIPREELVNMLMKKDHEENTILHHLTFGQDWGELSRELNTVNLEELIFHKNISQNSFLHKAFKNSDTGSLKLATSLLKNVETYLQIPQKIQKLNELKDKEGTTIQALKSLNKDCALNAEVRSPEEQYGRPYVQKLKTRKRKLESP